MRTQRNRRAGRGGPVIAAALAAAALACAACDEDLVDAIDNLRASAPNACKDYCEDKLACEWPAAEGTVENDAFAAGVQRCTVDCAFYMGLGAYAARNGLEGLEYFEHVSGGRLEDTLECALASGGFRCADGSPDDTHVFGAVVQSMCEDADACLGKLEIDQHLVWTPTTEGGGACVATGTEWLDAEFFLP
ncbi:MAG: hypothetical protein M0R80_06680 [Proteobacteria bacterium]|nr:hypothetical protein [Pseudomonadota bacterium]